MSSESVQWIIKPTETEGQTYTTLQMEGLVVSGEWHRRERIRIFSIVHLSQQAAAMNLDFSFRQGLLHSLPHSRVTETGEGGLARREGQMDTRSPDAEAEQSLHGGVHVDAVPINDGVI